MADSRRAVVPEASLLTVQQVASITQLSARAIWRLRSKGWIPSPIRVGGAVRWRRSEIEEWIADDCPKR
jgi:prophage regulatory protein